jgi:hypothetical protein
MLRLWLNDDEDEHLVAHIFKYLLAAYRAQSVYYIWQIECEGEEGRIEGREREGEGERGREREQRS